MTCSAAPDGRPSVLIVDDHAVVRMGLRLLLERSGCWRLAGEASDLPHAVELAGGTQPEVVLLDLNLRGENALHALPRLRAAAPAAAVVVLTMQESVACAAEAMRAGARGYLLKESSPEELLNALDHVIRGSTYLAPTIGARLATAAAHTSELTERERQVLSALSRGHTNEQVAATLHVSVRTVEAHRARLRDKLGATSRVELVAYARRHGL